MKHRLLIFTSLITVALVGAIITGPPPLTGEGLSFSKPDYSTNFIGFFDIIPTPFEEVTVLGTPVYVQVKFEYDYGFVIFNPNVPDLEIRFTLARTGEELDRVFTDNDGVAEFLFDPPSKGKFLIYAEVLDEDVKIFPIEIPVFVFDEDDRVIVSDIDGTLSDLEDFLIPFYGPDAPAYPDSPEVLRWLNQFVKIIYLTNRDDFLYEGTKEFLRKHDFPDSPTILNSWTNINQFPYIRNPLTPADFKKEVIEELLDRGLDVQLGIGNANSDAKAYYESGITSYIHREDNERITYPSIMYDSYIELKEMLKEELDLP
ncbi:phosphatase domain-containing protein [Bdellovibrionota bacterium]